MIFIQLLKIKTKKFIAFFYLAKFILALCPPLRETPLSPTVVLSPYGNCSKSVFNAQTCITFFLNLKIIIRY